jgi:hypothetical protein
MNRGDDRGVFQVQLSVEREESPMTTRRTRLLAVAATMGAAVAVTVTGSVTAAAGGGSDRSDLIQEQLSGYEEVPLALSTTGRGVFRAQIRDQEISYRLSYSGLEGTVTQAHIHFGSPSQEGGISVFLCSNLGNGPAGTQACPPAPATVSGTLRPADVLGPSGQGLGAGQFDELIAAIRADSTYVNVHSTLYPRGEMRGHIDRGHHH